MHSSKASNARDALLQIVESLERSQNPETLIASMYQSRSISKLYHYAVQVLHKVDCIWHALASHPPASNESRSPTECLQKNLFDLYVKYANEKATIPTAGFAQCINNANQFCVRIEQQTDVTVSRLVAQALDNTPRSSKQKATERRVKANVERMIRRMLPRDLPMSFVEYVAVPYVVLPSLDVNETTTDFGFAQYFGLTAECTVRAKSLNPMQSWDSLSVDHSEAHGEIRYFAVTRADILPMLELDEMDRSDQLLLLNGPTRRLIAKSGCSNARG